MGAFGKFRHNFGHMAAGNLVDEASDIKTELSI